MTISQVKGQLFELWLKISFTTFHALLYALDRFLIHWPSTKIFNKIFFFLPMLFIRYSSIFCKNFQFKKDWKASFCEIFQIFVFGTAVPYFSPLPCSLRVPDPVPVQSNSGCDSGGCLEWLSAQFAHFQHGLQLAREIDWRIGFAFWDKGERKQRRPLVEGEIEVSFCDVKLFTPTVLIYPVL